MSQAFHGGGLREAVEQFGLPADSFLDFSSNVNVLAPASRRSIGNNGGRKSAITRSLIRMVSLSKLPGFTMSVPVTFFPLPARLKRFI